MVTVIIELMNDSNQVMMAVEPSATEEAFEEEDQEEKMVFDIIMSHYCRDVNGPRSNITQKPALIFLVNNGDNMYWLDKLSQKKLSIEPKSCYRFFL